jgi:anaerobic selenocysteine-containing dehydrogenase
MIACTRDCYDTCIFDEEYRPLKLFPVNGFTCSRGIADLKRNFRNRVGSPMVEGKEVSLEEALDYVAKVIKGIDDKSKIIHVDYDGNQGLLTWYYPARLWNVLGASSTDYSICSLEGHEAIKTVYGTSFGALPEDFAKFKAVVFWGSEAAISFVHGWALLRDKYKVSVDVRLSETAKRSDKYVIVKPGTDVFLAIGVLKVLHARGAIKGVPNLEFYDLDHLSRVTGVPVEEMEELADVYQEMRPLTVIGFALGRSVNGGYAISVISQIPHYLGIDRGFFYSNSQGLGIDFSYLRGIHLAKPSKVVSMAEVGARVKEFKLIFVWNANPVISLPGGNLIREAVEEGEVTLVVHDPFWSETAKVANAVIPAPTFLEKEDVVYSYWHQYLVYNEPILPKKGVSEVKLMGMLARKLGVSHPLLEEDPWTALEVALKGTGVTVEELKREKVVKLSPKVEYRFKPLIPTPSMLEVPEGDTLVYSAHPNYTNSQFKEVYGDRTAVVYNSRYEGEGYLVTEAGKVKVTFKREQGVPSGVYFLFKSSLKNSEGISVNAVVSPKRGKFGGPILNVKVRVKV